MHIGMVSHTQLSDCPLADTAWMRRQPYAYVSAELTTSTSWPPSNLTVSCRMARRYAVATWSRTRQMGPRTSCPQGSASTSPSFLQTTCSFSPGEVSSSAYFAAVGTSPQTKPSPDLLTLKDGLRRTYTQ